MPRSRSPWFLAALCLAACRLGIAAETASADIVVYGGTCAGVMAAVQASRMGHPAVLIEPGRHLGGLTSGGLGWVDVGRFETIGGLAWDYFHRVWAHYREPAAWVFEKPRAMSGQGVTVKAAGETMWVLEPGVGERLFERMAEEAKVTVVRGERLDRAKGVRKENAVITAITMESGRVFRARMFIDATYEGDLMAAAGVPYVVGREARAEFGEKLAGIGRPELPFDKLAIDPWLVKGDPASGLLPRIVPAAEVGAAGAGDARVQAYCYRMCLTNEPRNRVPVAKPEGYDEKEYEIVFRAVEAGYPKDRFFKLSPMPNRKTDSNNHGPISTDLVGRSDGYTEADYATREKLAREHELWQRGLVWTLQNHPRVGEEVRKYYAPWGLPADEFADTGHWANQLYVREARRMRGEYVITENDCRQRAKAADPIGLGSYHMDSHYLRYVVGDTGSLCTEGGFFEQPSSPYGISYRAVIPKRADCTNLLVPICLSATHAAYGSLRMEPVFMILGQSVATAAALAIDRGTAVQDVDYTALAARLIADGQRLAWPVKSAAAAQEVKP